MRNLTRKEIETKIENNEYQIMMLGSYTSERDLMIRELFGDLSNDATIAFDSSYLDRRMDEEIKRIDEQIEESEKWIIQLEKENSHLKVLLNEKSKGAIKWLKWLKWLKKFRLQ